MVSIRKKFVFDSAHHLPNHLGACRRVHGHEYLLYVTVANVDGINLQVGDPEYGMVMDFKRLNELVKELVIDRLDHRDLNSIFPYPTAELMIDHIAKVISGALPKGVELKRLELYETATSCAIWEPAR